MRDIIITLIVFGSLPYILMRPYIGVLVCSWLGYMNPHRLAWGFAYYFPFVSIVAGVTIVSTVIYMLMSREKKSFPFYPATMLWMLFIAWMCFTTLFAMVPIDANEELIRTLKIQLIIFITLLVINNRDKLNLLVWVIAGSIGFYGIKGGIHSILTGGQYLVWGPKGSFIEGNNELALALIMVIPFMRYLQLIVEQVWMKRVFWACIGLTMISIVVSYSRGAFLALAVMISFLIIKTRHRAIFIVLAVVAVIGIGMFLPDKYWDRMGTIQSYDEDASAMGRINAWNFAYNIATHRPLTGGGFNVFDRDLFKRFAPIPEDFHDAHSIYFEVLGEHGFIGLFLFLAMWITVFFMGSNIIARTKQHENLTWAKDLVAMSQVSMVGYAAGGAFLGLAYYDLPYHIISIILIVRMIVDREIGPPRMAQISPWGNQSPALQQQARAKNDNNSKPQSNPVVTKNRFLPKGFISPYDKK